MPVIPVKKLLFLALASSASLACGSSDQDPSHPAAPSGGAAGAASGGSGGTAGAGGAGGTAGTSSASCPEGYPLTRLSGKPVVEVSIGDKGPYAFVYDTGAPDSGMDPALYDLIGAGPYTLKLGGKEVALDMLTVFPVKQYLNSDKVWGVIGANVMRHFAVTLDDQRSRFWLDDTRDEAALLACTHTTGSPVEVEYVESSYLFVPGKAEDKPGWFLIDTGASLGAMPSSVFDALDAAHPRPALQGFYTPAAIGTFWAELTSVGSLEMAGQKIEHIVTRTVTDDMIPAPKLDGPFLGVLPTGYLRHFLLTVDYPAGKLRVDGYAGMPPREPDGYYPLGIGLEASTEPPIHVSQVLPGSSAEEQGVQVGDEVVDVAGIDFASTTPYQRPWLLLDDTEHTQRTVTLLRDGKQLSVKLETRALLTDPKLE